MGLGDPKKSNAGCMSRIALCLCGLQTTTASEELLIYLDYIPIPCHNAPVLLDEGRQLEASCWRSGTGVRGRASQARARAMGSTARGHYDPPRGAR